MRVVARKDALPPLLDAVESWSAAAGLGPQAAYRLALVVEELAVNVASHGAQGTDGGATLSVAIARQGDAVQLVVEDDGQPFDPLSLPVPDTELPLESRRIGGLGVHLSRRLSRSLSYARGGGRNRVVVVLDAC
jgi:serine/threonine-protein kinase RsbW